MDSLLVENHPESDTFFKYNSESPLGWFNHQHPCSRITNNQGFHTSSSVPLVPELTNMVNQTPSFNTKSSELSQKTTNLPNNACIKFLSDILMEENLDCKPFTLQDCMALQAMEKSLCDAIREPYRAPTDQFPPISCPSKGRKYRQRDSDDGDEDGRCKKHLVTYIEDEAYMEQYDDILLCGEGKINLPISKEESTTKSQLNERAKGSKENVLDLSPLLNQCAQAVASFDLRGASDLLKQIRQQTSPFGDAIQRVGHYFANGLEARLAGTASQLYSDFVSWQISASQFLKVYRSYVPVVPFRRTFIFLANETLLKLCAKASHVHIIDFGVFFGIQWPCVIQSLSQRPGGPPKLKITAVEFPDQGYQPAASVEGIGKCLAGYCMRFNVPFEFHAIAQKWDTLKTDDFCISEHEMLFVNCSYKSIVLLDDTVATDNPRDKFLKLIRELNPDLFIHGIVNGSFNGPFFTSRFKEALYHYSTVFDMFETTMPRDGEERQMIERGLYGRFILNVVACEGEERINRPETHKQWRMRNRRAGFEEVALDRDIVDKAKAMVKDNYHKDFVVNQSNNWLLQGWKGRLLYGVSCWKPA